MTVERFPKSAEVAGGANSFAIEAVRRIFDSVDDPVFVYRPDATLVYVNEAYDELFRDRHPDGTLGKKVTELEPEKSHLVEEMVAANLARRPDEPDLVIESPSVHADGRPRWFEWRCIQDFDENDDVAFVIAISRDMTEQRLAELKAKRITERLEESNRDLLEFAQIASHDLQEPLRKVTAFANRLERHLGDDLDEKAVDYMGRMTGAVGRMQKLIEDLLTFARVTTRGERMTMTDLADVIRPVLSDLEIAIEESGATVTVSEMPTLPVDAPQLGQLFQNVIGNALKFRHDDIAPEITVTATHVAAQNPGGEPPNGWYDITIADNGVGFDEKFAGKIFAPFQRLHRASEFSGTGVGLSVCRRIAERHQGTISARSPEGEGATFVVRLPTSLLDEMSDAVQEAKGLSFENTVIDTAAA